jgi:hypothetical protein
LRHLEKGTGRREEGGEQTRVGLEGSLGLRQARVVGSRRYNGCGSTPSALAHLAAVSSGDPVTTIRLHGNNKKIVGSIGD